MRIMGKGICLFAIGRLSAIQSTAESPNEQTESTTERKHISEKIEQKKEKISHFIEQINQFLDKGKSNSRLVDQLKEIKIEIKNILDFDISEEEIDTKLQQLSKRILNLTRTDNNKT